MVASIVGFRCTHVLYVAMYILCNDSSPTDHGNNSNCAPHNIILYSYHKAQVTAWRVTRAHLATIALIACDYTHVHVPAWPSCMGDPQLCRDNFSLYSKQVTIICSKDYCTKVTTCTDVLTVARYYMYIVHEPWNLVFVY